MRPGIALLAALAALPATAQNQFDRTYAAWVAQILAANAGFAFEHKPAAVLPVTGLPPSFRGPAPVDDDYYYEIVALRAFERHGPALTIQQLGEQWIHANAGSWGSSAHTRELLLKGVKPPDTGHPRHNRLWFTIGPQFSADIYGMLAPGEPARAAALARDLGRINGWAEGVEGAVFVASMVSLAYTERDPHLIVSKAAAQVDPRSPYAACLRQVLDLAAAGKTFRQVADAVEDRWHIEYPATNNAVANGGLVAAAVYFGEGDFLKTLNLAVSAADFTDADCNAANACAVAGAMRGSAGLPAAEVARLEDRIHGDRMGPVTFSPPVDESIRDIAWRTVAVAAALAKASPRPAVAPELFPIERLAELWDPAWSLHHAGFGGAGGGLAGIPGLTCLDGDTLVTWPRDTVRGLYLETAADLANARTLHLEVGAPTGRAWRLEVYAGNQRLLSRLVEGDPQPTLGAKTPIRLYQLVLMTDRQPGSALWRKAVIR
jgi:hypothetical protein